MFEIIDQLVGSSLLFKMVIFIKKTCVWGCWKLAIGVVLEYIGILNLQFTITMVSMEVSNKTHSYKKGGPQPPITINGYN